MFDGKAAVDLGLADILSEQPYEDALGWAGRLLQLPAVQSQAVKRYFALLAPSEYADVAANDQFLRAAATDEAAATFDRFAGRPGDRAAPLAD